MTIHHRGGVGGDDLGAENVSPFGEPIWQEGFAGTDPSARPESPASGIQGVRLHALTLAGVQHLGGTAIALADVAAGDKGAVRAGGGIGESFAAMPPLKQAGASANDALAGVETIPVACRDGLLTASMTAGRFWPGTGHDPRQDLWLDDPFGPRPGDDWLGRVAEADSFVFHRGSDHDLAEDGTDTADRLVIQSAAEAWFDVRFTHPVTPAPADADMAGFVLPDFDPAPLPVPDFLF